MYLTSRQKANIGIRFWKDRESYFDTCERKGFQRLTRNAWFTIVNNYAPDGFEAKLTGEVIEKNNFFQIDIVEKSKMPYFMQMTEEEHFNFRCEKYGNNSGLTWKKASKNDL